MARIRDWATALGEVAQSGPLRRAQLSFGAMWAGESAFVVGLAVLAFRDGGVAAVGIVTGARMAAAALLAPLLATVADRVRRERVLACVGLVRAATLGGAAAITAAGGPIAATYSLAVVATVAQALFRPAHSALLPVLCTSPRQLTSANAVRGLLDSLATLSGPAAAAILQGFATIAADRRLALITSLGFAQTLTRGCLTVFTVVVAIQLLGTGDPGV